jgi:threonine dehydrogenase-like Zn-dependent dehydrogenase
MIVPPAVFGHELAGTIEEMDAVVTGWELGDRVVVSNSAPCGECFYCKNGQESLCDDLLFLNGAYAESIVVPARIVSKNMLRLKAETAFADAALVEPLACVVHGVEETRLRSGQRVLVLGSGPIGLMFVTLARQLGCEVTVVGRGEKRLALAHQLGAAHVMDVAGSDLKEVMGHKQEFDAVIEAVGKPETWEAAVQFVRKGGTVLSEKGTVSHDHPVWVKFARSMAPLMELPAQMIASLVNHSPSPKVKILDIAAGHGVFGIKLAEANPNAEIVAVDWPHVLEVAKENAAARGVSSRYKTLPGSAFEVDYGSGYDLVLLTNFLHHFDQPTCEGLLRKVHAALGSTGRVVALEFVPNEDRVSPAGTAVFSMMMLGTTPSGDAYTFSEYERMFSNSGFSRCELHPLPPTLEQAVISYK